MLWWSEYAARQQAWKQEDSKEGCLAMMHMEDVSRLYEDRSDGNEECLSPRYILKAKLPGHRCETREASRMIQSFCLTSWKSGWKFEWRVSELRLHINNSLLHGFRESEKPHRCDTEAIFGNMDVKKSASKSWNSRNIGKDDYLAMLNMQSLEYFYDMQTMMGCWARVP